MSIRITRSAGVLVLVILGVAPLATAQSLHDVRGEALRLYKAGRYQEALPLLNQVIERKHRDLDALNKRGIIYLRMNRPDLALNDFNEVCRYIPFGDTFQQQSNRQVAPDVPFPLTPQPYWSGQFFPQTFTDRGIAFLMLGRDDEAMTDFRHAINLYRRGIDPPVGLSSAYCGLGQALHHKGDDLDSYDAYQQAIRVNPNDPNGYVGLGNALVGLGRTNEALGSYTTGLRLDPNHPRAYGYRGVALERLGRNDEALADFAAALRVDPSATLFLRHRAALYSKLGRNDEAVSDLTEAIRLNPNDAAAYKDRGGVYNRRNDPTRGLADLTEAIRLDPKNARAFQNRAASYNALGQFDMAILDGDEAVRLEPKNAGAWTNRGLSLLALGRNEEAVGDLTRALELAPNLVAAHVNRGSAYARLGVLDRAQADFSEALRLAPGLALAQSGLDQVRDQQHLRARSAPLDVTDHSDPYAAARLRDDGDALRAAGDFAGAAAAYDRAVAADPGDAQGYALRGWSRLAAGLPGADADARAWLDQKGWRDPFAPYMALLGVLASRQPGHTPGPGDPFLTEALANSRPPAWPSPVFRYLKRTLSSTDLFTASDASGRRDEAETIVGLDLLSRGERTAALDHLRLSSSSPTPSISRDLARATLRRLEAAEAP